LATFSAWTPGNYTLTIKAFNACGMSQRIYNVVVNPSSHPSCVGVGVKIGAKIYPNPAKNELLVETDSGEEAEIILLDKFGIERMKSQTQQGKTKLYVNDLPRDLYILKIITQSNVFTEQVILE
jgi:hypothetical protein